MRPPPVIFSSIIMLLFSSVGVKAQSQEKVYASLILNFSKGIEWPKNPAGDFVIGVFEYAPLADELQAMSGSMKAGGKKILIKSLSTVEDAGSCDVLFIPAYKSRSMQALLDKIDKAATLIITNKINMAKHGSGVNFVLVDGRVKYEINCRSIEARGLKISSSIKSLGIVVD